MKFLLAPLALLLSTAPAFAYGPTNWACNLDNQTSLTFVQDGRKPAGTLTTFNGTIYPGTLGSELSSLGTGGQKVTFKRTGDVVTFYSGAAVVLTVDTSKPYSIGPDSYPWSGTLTLDAGPAVSGGCWGVAQRK